MDSHVGKDVGGYETQRLEAHLQENLRPVEPRPLFVSDLKIRLLTGESPAVHLSMGRFLFFGSAGLITSLFLLITGVRAGVRYYKKVRHPQTGLEMVTA